MEATPKGVSLEEVRRYIVEMDGVADVHDLHAWTITSGMNVVPAHVVMDEGADGGTCSIARAHASPGTSHRTQHLPAGRLRSARTRGVAPRVSGGSAPASRLSYSDSAKAPVPHDQLAPGGRYRSGGFGRRVSGPRSNARAQDDDMTVTWMANAPAAGGRPCTRSSGSIGSFPGGTGQSFIDAVALGSPQLATGG